MAMTIPYSWHCQQICQQPSSNRVEIGIAELERNSLATYNQTPDSIEEFEAELIGFDFRRRRPNDPSSATRRTGGDDCNRDAPAGFAAAHGRARLTFTQRTIDVPFSIKTEAFGQSKPVSCEIKTISHFRVEDSIFVYSFLAETRVGFPSSVPLIQGTYERVQVIR
jgi:hypothetical protein